MVLVKWSPRKGSSSVFPAQRQDQGWQNLTPVLGLSSTSPSHSLQASPQSLGGHSASHSVMEERDPQQEGVALPAG